MRSGEQKIKRTVCWKKNKFYLNSSYLGGGGGSSDKGTSTPLRKYHYYIWDSVISLRRPEPLSVIKEKNTTKVKCKNNRKVTNEGPRDRPTLYATVNIFSYVII